MVPDPTPVRNAMCTVMPVKTEYGAHGSDRLVDDLCVDHLARVAMNDWRGAQDDHMSARFTCFDLFYRSLK